MMSALIAAVFTALLTYTVADTGGFSATTGGAQPGARSFTVSTHTEMQSLILGARLDANGKKVVGGAYPLIITYTGNEDAMIAQVVYDHTVNASGVCPGQHWYDEYRHVDIRDFTRGVTIIGANGSSANFGLVVYRSRNVIIRNMKIGAMRGGAYDGDNLRVLDSSEVWIDHNELFGVNNECPNAPDGKQTFDGYLDIKGDSNNITVSYNYFHDAHKVGLLGGSMDDIGGGREITFHHNVYRNVAARIPLQVGGWTHIYNNLYDRITGAGINVLRGGYSLIERNYFQNSKNPIGCFFDPICGFWDLRANNIASPADFKKYGVVFFSSSTPDAANWTSTATFPLRIPYEFAPVSPQCLKDKLEMVAGVGKGEATLSAELCALSSSVKPVSSKSVAVSPMPSLAPSLPIKSASAVGGAPSSAASTRISPVSSQSVVSSSGKAPSSPHSSPVSSLSVASGKTPSSPRGIPVTLQSVTASSNGKMPSNSPVFSQSVTGSTNGKTLSSSNQPAPSSASVAWKKSVTAFPNTIRSPSVSSTSSAALSLLRTLMITSQLPNVSSSLLESVNVTESLPPPDTNSTLTTPSSLQSLLAKNSVTATAIGSAMVAIALGFAVVLGYRYRVRRQKAQTETIIRHMSGPEEFWLQSAPANYFQQSRQ